MIRSWLSKQPIEQGDEFLEMVSAFVRRERRLDQLQRNSPAKLWVARQMVTRCGMAIPAAQKSS